MEVKIGIQSVPRELVVETDTPADEIERQLASALSGDQYSVFALAMSKGGNSATSSDRGRAGRVGWVDSWYTR